MIVYFGLTSVRTRTDNNASNGARSGKGPSLIDADPVIICIVSLDTCRPYTLWYCQNDTSHSGWVTCHVIQGAGPLLYVVLRPPDLFWRSGFLTPHPYFGPEYPDSVFFCVVRPSSPYLTVCPDRVPVALQKTTRVFYYHHYVYSLSTSERTAHGLASRQYLHSSKRSPGSLWSPTPSLGKASIPLSLAGRGVTLVRHVIFC